MSPTTPQWFFLLGFFLLVSELCLYTHIKGSQCRVEAILHRKCREYEADLYLEQYVRISGNITAYVRCGKVRSCTSKCNAPIVVGNKYHYGTDLPVVTASDRKFYRVYIDMSPQMALYYLYWFICSIGIIAWFHKAIPFFYDACASQNLMEVAGFLVLTSFAMNSVAIQIF